MGISWLAACVAGVLSFLSPCVLPLVPPYLCYMAGVSMEELKTPEISGQKYRFRWSVLLSAIGFVLGFTVVFVTLGASATALGALVQRYLEWFTVAAGIIIILMGLHFLGVFRFMLLSREARFHPAKIKAGPIGSFIMGLAFAFGWTPCIGPVLGPLLTYASIRETVFEGAALLAIYSLGLGIPFLLAALFSSLFMVFLAKFRVHLGKVEKVMGVFLIVAGIMFLTGQMQSISYWLLENVQFLQSFI